MTYKEELQNKNAEILQRRFNEESIPVFIRRYFIDLDSKAGALKYWGVIRDCMIWLMDNQVIDKKPLENIVPDDFIDVDSQDIKLYLLDKEQQGLTKSTVSTKKNILCSFWEYLVNSNKCSVRQNVVKITKYKGKSSNYNLVKKLPSEQQIYEMESKIKKKPDLFTRTRNYSVLQVLKGSGLRECELAGLNMDDLFLDKEAYESIREVMPCVKIIGKRAYSEEEARLVCLTGNAVKILKEWCDFRQKMCDKMNILMPCVKIIGKRAYSEEEARLVCLTGNAVKILKEWCDFRQKMCDKMNILTDAVFVNKNGTRMKEKNIYDMFVTYGNGMTPHMIRHWYATKLANAGGVEFAQQQLGHSSVNTTLGYYAKISGSMIDVMRNM